MKRFLPILFCAILLVAIQPSGAAQSATERDSATVRLYRISTFFADQSIFDVCKTYMGLPTVEEIIYAIEAAAIEAAKQKSA